jgi:hypothetical protein
VTFTSGLPDAATVTGGLSFTGVGNQSSPAEWTLSGIADLDPGTYTFRATVDDGDSGSTDVYTEIAVGQENADATYDGPLFVSTDTGHPDNGVVPLRAVIRDITAFEPLVDTEAGLITSATVRFINRDTGAIIASGLPVFLLGSDPKVGVATFDWPVSLEHNEKATSFDVGVEVDGFYTATAEDVLITVARPDDDFITAKGFIVNQNSAGVYAGGDGLETTYKIDVKFKKKLTELKGDFDATVRRDDGTVLDISSDNINSFVVVPTIGVDGHATFIGTATLTDVTKSKKNKPIPIAENLQLIVNVTDNGEPGQGKDSISFALWDGSTLLYSSNFDGTKTVEQPIAHGQIQVHLKTKPLLAAQVSNASTGSALTPDSLPPFIADAIGYWADAGADHRQLALLNNASVSVVDLPGPRLGVASESLDAVWLDVDAAGYGWNIDSSLPGGMDLLSALAHEFGHLLGLEDSSQQLDIMGSHLAPSVRRTANVDFVQPWTGVRARSDAGFTRFDEDITAIDAMHAEWPYDASRADRVVHSCAVNGLIPKNASRYSLTSDRKKTAFDGAEGEDKLTGWKARDRFFAALTDDATGEKDDELGSCL